MGREFRKVEKPTRGFPEAVSTSGSVHAQIMHGYDRRVRIRGAEFVIALSGAVAVVGAAVVRVLVAV